MKRCWSLLLAMALLLGGCAPQAQSLDAASSAAEASQAGELPPKEVESVPEPEDGQPEPLVYVPPDGMTVEETVLAYFEQQYQSYLTFTDVDLTAILDPAYASIRHSILWTSKLNQRRRLLSETGLCYVETERFPYEIVFIEPDVLEDERLSMWDVAGMTEMGEVLVHFEIRGDVGKAYPPQMPVNTQHTMRLFQFDGVWKIIFHYFPGSIRKYLHRDGLDAVSDRVMLRELEREFSLEGLPENAPEYPDSAARYDEDAAVDYALRYTESYNDTFYRVSHWLGDCANFISQCVWAGFGGEEAGPFSYMTDGWYAGEGGGSPAWENVEYFWQYVMEQSGLLGQPLRGVPEVWPGDLIQTSSPGFEGDGNENQGGDGSGPYHHCLLVVDADTLLLAQHSPNTFVYYADLVNVETRMIRPTALLSQ